MHNAAGSGGQDETLRFHIPERGEAQEVGEGIGAERDIRYRGYIPAQYLEGIAQVKATQGIGERGEFHHEEVIQREEEEVPQFERRGCFSPCLSHVIPDVQNHAER